MVNNKRGTRGAYRLIQFQGALILLSAWIVYLIYDRHTALSVILGGIVSILPNAYFAMTLFRYHGARAAQKIVRNFYRGEAVKLLMTVGLFAIIFKMTDVAPLALMMGFIMAQLVFWFAPLIFK